MISCILAGRETVPETVLAVDVVNSRCLEGCVSENETSYRSRRNVSRRSWAVHGYRGGKYNNEVELTEI